MDAVSGFSGEHHAIPLHLLRLVSQGLPVGGFSYSRGLEGAVQAGWVSDEATARDWILGTLQANVAQLDGALFWRMALALEAGDTERFRAADAWLAAGRESLEFQREDRRLGEALLRLLADLDVAAAAGVQGEGLTYAAAFALAAHHWRIAPFQALTGLLWIYVEGQVTAAIRLVPLGHTAGQRILIDAVGAIEEAAALARSIDDQDIGNLAPALAMASAWHESQYSRLFQS
ncbi:MULTISPECIES: urease accessory UreF family protein [unclassified Chelatococcus]|uniref:urease accessory protein UreF n=1 Tax=unclassified Chelatococcus TaxID=2638111 RepID=UPI001BCE7102|nr:MULTISPECIES: urease accessory UreF family protein [unclassified Chelatococcus]MBS7698897.1 urease accessory protein UreF [Chelatococcus sp. YT9]MBX3559527.1 urease accessory protein UreF [Chelatococcus sp.]